MRYSTQIKPISYVKAHAAALIDRITREREPIIITQHGEARAVLMDIRSYEEAQERMATLQLMAAGESAVNAAQPLSRADVFSEFSGRKPAATPVETLELQEGED